MLKFLGKDSGFGDKNTSAYFEDGNTLTIIDCGFSIFNEIKNKFDFKKYRTINIVITHLHNDHAGSLSQLVLYLYFIYNIKVTIISKCDKIKEYLEITGTPDNAYELKESLDNLKFIKTEHVKYLDSYGFKANLNNKNIIYTGDTSTLHTFIPYINNEVDELYVDVSKNGGAHLKIEDILDLLREIKNNGTKIFLMHIDDKKYIKKIVKNEFDI